MSASLDRRVRSWWIAAVCLLLAMIGPAAAHAQPTEKLNVSVTGGTVSLEAVNAPLDQVLIKLGEALRARIRIETVLAGDLANTRVTRTFSGLAPDPAFRRLLVGRNYVLVQGPNGVDEVRVFVDGSTGYRDLTASNATAGAGQGRRRPISRAERPGDDPNEVARLRQVVLSAPDPADRRQALEELASVRDSGTVRSILTQVIGRERDAMVLQTVLEVAAQQEEGLPPETLRSFVSSDRDASIRAQAVDQLAQQAGAEPATRTVLRSLAASDPSSDVREAAQAALQNLEPEPAPARSR